MGNFKDISDAKRIYLFKYGLESRYVDLLNLKNPINFVEAIGLISAHGTAYDMRMAQTNNEMSEKMDIDVINKITTTSTDTPNINLIDNNYDADTFLYNINGIEVPISVTGWSGKNFLNQNTICWSCGKPGHRRANCRKPRQNKNYYNNGFYSGYKRNNYTGKNFNLNRNNQYKGENSNAKGYYNNNSSQNQKNSSYTNYSNNRNEENVFTNNENDNINAFEGNDSSQ
ncbi:hypothetical protein BB561_006231 [Smittium simulii]|uniref:CCHC-type domain-containing protein n=1 Tax=Smittium simulii TaxID=133385 RepID=A0A2T9Y5Q9_9FUNG|nr:hypothetical protein BB561_006231 [Smittium simulii]